MKGKLNSQDNPRTYNSDFVQTDSEILFVPIGFQFLY